MAVVLAVDRRSLRPPSSSSAPTHSMADAADRGPPRRPHTADSSSLASSGTAARRSNSLLPRLGRKLHNAKSLRSGSSHGSNSSGGAISIGIGSSSNHSSNSNSRQRTLLFPEVIEISAETTTAAVHNTAYHDDDEEEQRLRDAAALSIGLNPAHLPPASIHESVVDEEDELLLLDEDRYSARSASHPHYHLNNFSNNSRSSSHRIASTATTTGTASTTASVQATMPPFPTTPHALSSAFLVQQTALLPTYHVSPSLRFFNRSRLWRTRSLLLTCPPLLDSSQSSSSHSSTPRATPSYLHLFHGERELGRMIINSDSVVFIFDQEVGGRSRVVKVGGEVIAGSKVTHTQDGHSVWILQMADPEVQQLWIGLIKNAILRQRTIHAGLPTSVGGNDAVGPRGDLDVMLSLRKQQGGISTPVSPPSSSTHLSPIPSPVESRFPVSSKTLGPLDSSAASATSIAASTGSHRSKTASASPPASPSSTSSSNGAVSVLRGLFRVRSSSDAPSPPTLQTEKSFGTAGLNLLALEKQQQSKSPTASTSTSMTTMPTYMHHHGSTPPLIGQRITEWPISLEGNDAARRMSVGAIDTSAALSMGTGTGTNDLVRAQRTLSVGASPLNPPPRRRSNTTSGAFSPASSIIEQPIAGGGVGGLRVHQDGGSVNGRYQNGNGSIRGMGATPAEMDEIRSAQQEKDGEAQEQGDDEISGLAIPSGFRSPSRNSFGVVGGVGVSGSMSSSREPSSDRARAPSVHSVSTYASGSAEQQQANAAAAAALAGTLPVGVMSSPLDRSGSNKGRKRWSRQSGGILPKRLTPPSGPPPAVPEPSDGGDNGNGDISISHNRGGSASTTPYGGDLSSSWSGSSSMLAVNGNGAHGYSPGGGSLPRWSKRASASSAISFGSTWSSSQQQHNSSAFSTVSVSATGGGGTLSRPGSSHRNSMPPPPRPAPTFAPPPIPTAPAANVTENGNGRHHPATHVKLVDPPPALAPLTKSLSRGTERAHRLSFLAPKPPPTTGLPPRPDELTTPSSRPLSSPAAATPTSKHHRRSSSASTSMPLYSIPASPEEPASAKPIPAAGTPTLVSRSATFVERLRRRSTPNSTIPVPVEQMQGPSSLQQEHTISPDASPRNSNEAAAPSSSSSGHVTPLTTPTALTINVAAAAPVSSSSAGPAQYVLASPAHNHLFSSALSSHPHRSSAPASSSPIGQALITTQQNDSGFLNRFANATPPPGRSAFFDDAIGGNGSASGSPLPSASLFGNTGSSLGGASGASGDEAESMTSLSPPPRRYSRQLPAPPKGLRHSAERSSGSNSSNSNSTGQYQQQQQQDSETETATNNSNKLTIQRTGSVVSLGFVSL